MSNKSVLLKTYNDYCDEYQILAKNKRTLSDDGHYYLVHLTSHLAYLHSKLYGRRNNKWLEMVGIANSAPPVAYNRLIKV